MKHALLAAASIAAAFAVPGVAQFSAALAAPGTARAAAKAPQSGGYTSINNYSLDDGTAEQSIGLTAGGTVVAIQKFTTVGPTDVITKVKAAFSSPLVAPAAQPAVGDPINVFVWQDGISQDGNPTDATLVSTAAGVITNVANNGIDTFTVPPALVSGVFFVGVSIVHTAGKFPTAMDLTTPPGAGVAWVTGNGVGIPYTGVPVTGTIGLVDCPTLPFPANGSWILRAEGGMSTVTYCTAKTNSLNGGALCPNGVPVISSIGASSATLLSGFTIRATNCRNNKIGILLYKNSVAGSAQGAQFPFTGGFLCFATGFNPNRSTAVTSGGTPAPVDDCSGVFSIDMNAFAHGVLPPPPAPQAYLLVNGQEVCAQFWGRDPGFAPPNNTQLSDAMMWNIGP